MQFEPEHQPADLRRHGLPHSHCMRANEVLLQLCQCIGFDPRVAERAKSRVHAIHWMLRCLQVVFEPFPAGTDLIPRFWIQLQGEWVVQHLVHIAESDGAFGIDKTWLAHA